MQLPEIYSLDDLPLRFPIFPLPGCLLFPGSQLPLNIFEPRYLNMIDDIRAGDGVIGMIQSYETGPKTHPDIASVGCLGQLTGFQETEDGRYLITLTGVCRFRVEEELPFEMPYREIRADWTEFEHDLFEPEEEHLPHRADILEALGDYLSRNGLAANLEDADKAPTETLVNALSAGCPFSIIEKQALLEAPDLVARAEVLVTLLQMDGLDTGGSSSLQ